MYGLCNVCLCVYVWVMLCVGVCRCGFCNVCVCVWVLQCVVVCIGFIMVGCK